MATHSIKRYLSVLIVVLIGLSACTSQQPEPPPDSAREQEPPSEPEAPRGRPFAIVKTSEGDLTFELLPELAPKAVENFIKLAQKGFYYKTTFHRVMAGIMIQGGDPNSRDNNPYNDGQGNSGAFLPAEFSKVPFERGTVAMARQAHDPSSASCQFFVCLKRSPHWDGEYTVFAKVVDGIDVADKISKSPLSKDPNLKDRPTARMWIKEVMIEYRDQ